MQELLSAGETVTATRKDGAYTVIVGGRAGAGVTFASALEAALQP
jgi:hypothetical protein